MARYNGRDMRFKDAAGEVIGVATGKSFTVNNNPVDVTGDDDAGFVTLLSRPGTKQITCDITFNFDDTAPDLRDVGITGSALLAAYTIEFVDNADAAVPNVLYSIMGDFFLASVGMTGNHDGAIEGTASLQSSGAWERTTA